MLNSTAKKRLERLEDDFSTLQRAHLTLQGNFEILQDQWQNEQHSLRSITGRLNRALRDNDNPPGGTRTPENSEGLDPISAAIFKRRALGAIPTERLANRNADGSGPG